MMYDGQSAKTSYLAIRTLNRLVETKLDELQLPKLYKTELLTIYEVRNYEVQWTKTGRPAALSYLVIRTFNRLVEAKLDELQLSRLYKLNS